MTKRELILAMIDFLETNISVEKLGLCSAFNQIMSKQHYEMLTVLPELDKYRPNHGGSYWYGTSPGYGMPFAGTNRKGYYGPEARIRILVELLGEMSEEQLTVIV